MDRLRLQVNLLAARFGYGLVNYRHPTRKQWLKHALSPKVRTVTTPLERAQLAAMVEACECIPGDLAEAGVFQGGTASIMLRSSKKPLHLFDTFEGLPADEGQLSAGEYTGALEDVKKTLAPWSDRISFHPGLFPQSAEGFEARFSFVHLDLDLYESTRGALGWFWPRLNPGGVIISHDYLHMPGVERAFREFFGGSNAVLPLTGCQCFVVKR